MHSILADNSGNASVFKAGDDSHTNAELEASILERATELKVANSTLVGEYFLGEAESSVPSAFSIGRFLLFVQLEHIRRNSNRFMS